MSATVIPFKPVYQRSRETELWDAYLWAFQKVQAEYPNPDVETLRACVSAWDAFVAEIDGALGRDV